MWEKIQVQSNCIEINTEKSVLINLPKTSKYKGFSFWHTAKCCRFVGKNSYLLQISFTNEFKFNLKKYGKGQYNYKDILEEKVIGADEIKEAFGFKSNDDLYEELKDEA